MKLTRSIRSAPRVQSVRLGSAPVPKRLVSVVVRAEGEKKEPEVVESEVVENAAAQSPLEVLKAFVHETEDERQVTMKENLAALEAELAELKARAEGSESTSAAAMGQYATIKDQYVRLTADFDNFRRRSQTEKESLSTAAKEDVVKLFLPLIDNFDLARQQLKPATEGEEKINNSYQGLYRQMVEIFRKLGVEAVETVGAAFDPNLHEAIMSEDREDVMDSTVLEEFRKGFALNGKLVRPAMVKVSNNPDQPRPTTPKEGEPAASTEA